MSSTDPGENVALTYSGPIPHRFLGTNRYFMLRNRASGPRTGHRGSGPDLGKRPNRPSGKPKAGRRPDFEGFPARIGPKSGPKARLPARMQYCVT